MNNKELEEIKSIVAIHFGALGFLNPSENEQILKDRDKVLNALTELQSIKEANPSEALNSVDFLKDDGCIITLMQGKALEIIRQYILKAQEQEKVLSIIKEKNVDIYELQECENVEQYNKKCDYWGIQLTEEEFDLLKRWLG